MNDRNISGFAGARFVGQRVPRKEDVRLLTGRGAYVDDVALPGMLQIAFVRSPLARARICRIEVGAARAVPGVHAILTADDLARLEIQLPGLHGANTTRPSAAPLAQGRVACVGEAVAMVLAEDRYLAEDAAGLVEVDYEAEPAVVTMAEAASGPPVHPELGTNLAAEIATPDDPEIAEIFATAAHVVEGTIVHQRQAHSPMETRGIVVSPPSAGEVTIRASCQSPHMAAHYFDLAFNRPELKFRVLSKDVGGAFGLKVQPWREECAAVAAALLLGRPVKWIEDRLENLTAANQAREQICQMRYAFDADARLLAAEVDYQCNLGAWPHMVGANDLAMMMFPGPYKLPKFKYRARAWYSNTAGEAAYRGPWAMESLGRETMLDKAARQIAIDPVEIRRRNLITAADQPHAHPTGVVVHGVTPTETLDLVLQKLDLANFRAEQARARAEGRLVGLGLAVYLEPTTMAQGGVLTSDVAQVRVEPNGKVTAVLSTHSQGHGTETTMAQVVAEHLGVPLEDVTVLEDDSSRGGFGPGAGGSRQAVAGGGAAIEASRLLLGKIKRVAAHLMNANPEHVELKAGKLTVEGVPEVAMNLSDLAAAAYYDADRLPPDTEPGLEAQYRYRPPPIVFSNAAHACVCEVDAETGRVKILRWIASEDCGVMINPAIVEGQIAGGVMQGIGGVLLEEISYDGQGNPTAATFKDYLLPTLQDAPVIEFCHLITPSDSQGGFKGVGEGGAIIGPPTMVNAVADALAPFGADCMRLPLSPARLLEIIEAAPVRGP